MGASRNPEAPSVGAAAALQRDLANRRPPPFRENSSSSVSVSFSRAKRPDLFTVACKLGRCPASERCPSLCRVPWPGIRRTTILNARALRKCAGRVRLGLCNIECGQYGKASTGSPSGTACGAQLSQTHLRNPLFLSTSKASLAWSTTDLSFRNVFGQKIANSAPYPEGTRFGPYRTDGWISLGRFL